MKNLLTPVAGIAALFGMALPTADSFAATPTANPFANRMPGPSHGQPYFGPPGMPVRPYPAAPHPMGFAPHGWPVGPNWMPHAQPPRPFAPNPMMFAQRSRPPMPYAVAYGQPPRPFVPNPMMFAQRPRPPMPYPVAFAAPPRPFAANPMMFAQRPRPPMPYAVAFAAPPRPFAANPMMFAQRPRPPMPYAVAFAAPPRPFAANPMMFAQRPRPLMQPTPLSAAYAWRPPAVRPDFSLIAFAPARMGSPEPRMAGADNRAWSPVGSAERRAPRAQSRRQFGGAEPFSARSAAEYYDPKLHDAAFAAEVRRVPGGG
jgi:hypothetical protein